jgi:hypothetical protein
MATWTTVSTRRTFCFDVEARPGPWAGSDFTFRSMLSLAGCYEDDPAGMRYLPPGFTASDLEWFVGPFRGNCLIVTHNGPRYDLPFLNGTLIKFGLDPLPRLLVSDTYAHFPKRGQAFSASLGNLAQRFDVEHQKGSMSEVDWDGAYAGEKEALEKLREYNTGDVLTTLSLRKALMEVGLLRSPRMWSP